LPIIELEKLKCINLQYGDVEEEIDKFKNDYNLEFDSINWVDKFNNIDELATLIFCCDFIVTTSNVTAHISGALGKKTYLLVPYSQGKIWYWHEGYKQSLWYPSISIYWQNSNFNWDDAITLIKTDIKKTYKL
jgi:ADP-heptose:LPS heptosyltransferase